MNEIQPPCLAVDATAGDIGPGALWIADSGCVEEAGNVVCSTGQCRYSRSAILGSLSTRVAV
jgi:hypothetical protein